MDFAADLDDLADRLVPDAVTRLVRAGDLGRRRIVAVVDVQVAAADTATVDPHQHLPGIGQRRIPEILVADLFGAVVNKRFHECPAPFGACQPFRRPTKACPSAGQLIVRSASTTSQRPIREALRSRNCASSSVRILATCGSARVFWISANAAACLREYTLMASYSQPSGCPSARLIMASG